MRKLLIAATALSLGFFATAWAASDDFWDGQRTSQIQYADDWRGRHSGCRCQLRGSGRHRRQGNRSGRRRNE